MKAKLPKVMKKELYEAVEELFVGAYDMAGALHPNEIEDARRRLKDHKKKLRALIASAK